MSFDNILIFTGHFVDSSNNNLLGKKLYIPLTQNHPAITLKITRTNFPGHENLTSLIIDFNSEREREIIANFDFQDATFYVDP